jgi:hypothetical protein
MRQSGTQNVSAVAAKDSAGRNPVLALGADKMPFITPRHKADAETRMAKGVIRNTRHSPHLEIGRRGAKD